LKIAYLHGLDSNNFGPKYDWLNSISELFGPSIDYRENRIFHKIKKEIQKFQPDFIIGSSMGGYFAYEIAKELNIKALLFNPALHSRSYEPDIYGLENNKFNPTMYFILGKNDSIINPYKTIEIIENEGFTYQDFSLQSYAHDTSLELFKKEVLSFIESQK